MFCREIDWADFIMDLKFFIFVLRYHLQFWAWILVAMFFFTRVPKVFLIWGHCILFVFWSYSLEVPYHMRHIWQLDTWVFRSSPAAVQNLFNFFACLGSYVRYTFSVLLFSLFTFWILYLFVLNSASIIPREKPRNIQVRIDMQCRPKPYLKRSHNITCISFWISLSVCNLFVDFHFPKESFFQFYAHVHRTCTVVSTVVGIETRFHGVWMPEM